MIRDRHQFRAQPAFVMVYCLYGNENDYTLIGEGLFQVVTDQYMFQYEHYVEVTDKATGEIFLRSRLQPTNQYERQKSTVIAWSDPEQDVQNHIGISFEDEVTCEMNWRLLCSKIGKNYLEINGREKLDMPNEGNVRMLVQKIRNSYNLVAYHIINSQDFMNAFWETLSKLSSKQLPLNGIRILRELLSNYDPKIMTIILSDPNFCHFLQVYQRTFPQLSIDQCGINFRSYYKQSAATVINQDLVKLNEPALNSIELALRAKFVKQCVIDYGKDLMVANMLAQVIKDSETEALINMIRDGYIQKIVKVCKNSRANKQDNGQHKAIKQQNKEQHKSNIDEQHLDQDSVTKKVLAFFLQAAWIIRIYHIDNTKVIFLSQFYSLGMLGIIGDMINEGYFKALEVLGCIAELDSTLFLTEFINDYRNDPANSIVRKIGKQFSESPLEQYKLETISFLRSLIIPMQQSKPTFEFINKTITFVVFTCCKHPQRVLPLINFYISELGAVRAIFEHIMKFKYFETLAEKLAEVNKKGQESLKMPFHKQEIISKSALLQIIRVMRSVLELNKPQIPEKEQQQKQQKNKKKQKHKIKQIKQSPQIVTKINHYVIDSKLFPECLSYLLINIETNNIITSAIMQLLQILSTLPLNPLTLYIQSSFVLSKAQIAGQRLQFLLRCVDKIKAIKAMQTENIYGRKGSKELGDTRKRVHQTVLDEQQEEKYLQKQDNDKDNNQQQKTTHQDEKTEQMRNIELQANMKKLIEIKTEIASKEEQDEQAKRKKQMKDRMDKLKAQKKSEDTIGFNLQEFQDNSEKQ